MIITIQTQQGPLQATSLPDARLMLAHRNLEANSVTIAAPDVGYEMVFSEYNLAVFNRGVRNLKETVREIR